MRLMMTSMMKNKTKSSLKNIKRGFFDRLATKKENFVSRGLPFIKAIAPQILMIFGSCLYVGLGLFCAAILGVLSIHQENAPWYICVYAFVYFSGLAGLIFAEHRLKKNRHFITYILLTTPVNLIIVLFYNA